MEIDRYAPRSHPETCSNCSAISGDECPIAGLQIDKNREPYDKDAREQGINIDNIPVSCPNGYASPPIHNLVFK